MSVFPGSSAASHASQHACARHPGYVAPRFCTGCGDRLCTACARYRAHKTCPSCNVAAGRAPLTADVGWYAILCVDGFVHALSRLRTRVLPLAVLASLLATGSTVILALLGGALSFQESGAEQLPLLLGAAALGVALCVGLQPALALPTTSPLSFLRQSWRALIGGLLPSAILGAAFFGSVALFALGEVVGSGVVSVLGILVGLFTSLLALAFSSLALPIQAAYAVGHRSLLGALKAPFAGGLAPVGMMSAVWLAFLSLSYSAMYGVLVPVVFIAVFLPWAGAFVGVVATVIALSFLLLSSAAYATGSLRMAEDRARP